MACSHLENNAILIFGPTAVGKTEFIYGFLGSSSYPPQKKVEIISADSRQIYRDIKIATAYPSESLLERIPHHLIGNKNPSEDYNVFDFVKDAKRCIVDIHARGNIPLVVGGTAFYLYNIWKGTPQTPSVDPKIRDELKHKSQERGQEYMYQWLSEIDNAYASTIANHDTYRTMRALEVFCQTGKKLSDFMENNKDEDFTYRVCGLTRERANLYKRINDRVDTMWKQGLLDEVYSLWKKDIPHTSNVMKTIGVQEFILDKDVRRCWEAQIHLPYAQAIQLLPDILARILNSIKQHSRNYAKRQITFFKRFDDVTWIDLDTLEGENKQDNYCRVCNGLIEGTLY